MVNRIISVALTLACLSLAIVLFRDRTQQQIPCDSALAPNPPRATPEDEALLDRRIATINLDDVPLEDAIVQLSDLTNVNIRARWQQLEDDGISRRMTIRLHRRNVTLGQVLTTVFTNLSRRDRSPCFDVADGIVTITSSEDVARHVVEFINIRALLVQLTPAGYGRFAGLEGEPLPTYAEMVNTLSAFIMAHVDHESWIDEGGRDGLIRSAGGILLIRQRPENIREIRKLLNQLSRSTEIDPFSAPSNSTDHAIVDAIPTSGPDQAALKTEFINIRPLVERIWTRRNGSSSSSPALDDYDRTRGEIVREILQFVLFNVDASSWSETGGKAGDIRDIGGILAIRQSPANLRSIHVLLDDLYRSTAREELRATTKYIIPAK